MHRTKGGFNSAKAAEKAQQPKNDLLQQGETDRRVKKSKRKRQQKKRHKKR